MAVKALRDLPHHSLGGKMDHVLFHCVWNGSHPCSHMGESDIIFEVGSDFSKHFFHKADASWCGAVWLLLIWYTNRWKLKDLRGFNGRIEQVLIMVGGYSAEVVSLWYRSAVLNTVSSVTFSLVWNNAVSNATNTSFLLFILMQSASRHVPNDSLISTLTC